MLQRFSEDAIIILSNCHKAERLEALLFDIVYRSKMALSVTKVSQKNTIWLIQSTFDEFKSLSFGKW